MGPIWSTGADPERSEALVKRSQIDFGEARSAQGRSRAPKRPLRGLQEASKRPPRGLPEVSKRPPRGLQEVSKRSLRGFQRGARVEHAWGHA